MAKAIDLRQNRAKAQVAPDLNAKFTQGQGMATDRQHPTDVNKHPHSHTTDDGARA